MRLFVCVASRGRRCRRSVVCLCVQVKQQVQKVKDKAQLIVDEIEADKRAAESKLEAARPALEAAEAALQVRHTHTALCVTDSAHK